MSDNEVLLTRDRREIRRIARINRQIFSLEDEIIELDKEIVTMIEVEEFRTVKALRDLRDSILVMIGKLLEFTVAVSKPK